MSDRMSEERLAEYYVDEYGIARRRGTAGTPPYVVPFAYDASPNELLAALRAERTAYTTLATRHAALVEAATAAVAQHVIAHGDETMDGCDICILRAAIEEGDAS